MTQLTLEYFDVKKAGQLVYYFLHKAGTRQQHTTKLRLAKWLYLAERYSYEEFGSPMVGDRLGAMEHGPATSELVAIIEKKSRNFDGKIFEKIISINKVNKHQYVELVENCLYSSIDELDRFSQAEIDLLDTIWEKYGSWSAVKLENHLHDTTLFPEWNWKPGDGTNWIELEAILTFVGFHTADIGLMVENILAFSAIDAANTSVQ